MSHYGDSTTDAPPPPDPRITPTTTHGNYPSTQEQLVKNYLDKPRSKRHWTVRIIDLLLHRR